MPKRRTFSVALIGTKFMGRAHSTAWRQAPRFFDLPADIRMAVICGRDPVSPGSTFPESLDFARDASR